MIKIVTIDERNKKFYTEKGIDAMKQRMNTFVRLYNDENENFGKELMMFGFGKFIIYTKEECLFRIKELAELTGSQVSKSIMEEKMTNGEVVKTERLEVV